MTFPALVYILCFVTSVFCAVLLVRAFDRTRRRLLFWCAVSFALLAVNNTLVLADMLWPPEGNLLALRQAAALGAVTTLICGFLWDVER